VTAGLPDQPAATPAATPERADGATGYGYDAILLTGFGGPEGPDDVLPFLRNVTSGRGVPDERLAEVAEHYRALGGTSPINEQTRNLRDAVQAELVDRGIALPVLWGNRNWHPYLAETVKAARESGRHRLLGVTTSAYSSYSSCRQYREDFAAALLASESLGTVTIDKVRPYYDQPGFLEPFIDATVDVLRTALAARLDADDIEVVFTTHSLPSAMADASGSATFDEHGDGGAYRRQHLAACRAVMAGVGEQLTELPGEIRWQLAFQSRSGGPTVPWLEPDIGDALRALAADGRRAVIVVPIGFVSDHVEVIWDLDTEAARLAADLELSFWRVPTPGTDTRFVAGLVDLIAERLGRGLPHAPMVELPARPEFCAAGCCVNLSGPKPTTAGQDSVDDWTGLDVARQQLVGSGICARPSGTGDSSR
jgi:ferrochelatase